MKSTQLVQRTRAMDWATMIRAQQDAYRTGQYQRIGRLDAMSFEFTETSNPKMRELSAQRNAQGKPAWPGINLDWLNQGPVLALGAGGGLKGSPEVLLASVPFPLPPDCPDPEWTWSEANPEPKRIPQLLTDRAMRIKGTNFLIIQPVIQLNWVLDLAVPGHARREIHSVRADFDGIHMAFIYDPDLRTGHLIGGDVE